MTCATVLALVGAVSVTMGKDTVALAPHPDGGAVLCYHNVDPPHTNAGTATLTAGNVTATATVSAGTKGREDIAVTPAGGWFVWPADDALQHVPDGEAVTIRIIGGLS